MQSSYVFLPALAILPASPCERARRSGGGDGAGYSITGACAARNPRTAAVAHMPCPRACAGARSRSPRECGGRQLQEAREDNVRAYPITKIIAPLALLASVALSTDARAQPVSPTPPTS